ncbi:hypothetical protein [Flammeovirga sp. EKP202]|uniref:hypothetical protein n=1 Tax=Flammeovirga sp. EKP202 TaxID=2770592 RepID=UPI0019CDC220|nr:hypothetical protein [Flammeovirga sp. EKP202]MBD0401626.1 hypothetical protein [Flammeovirga sp. EKP202]
MIIILWSCNNSKNTERTSTSYPNGGSELAWLMRDATDQMEAQKKAILNGDSINKLLLDVNHILTAVPTEEGKTTSPAYQAMAKQFLEHVGQQEQIPLEGQVEFYNATISQCINCHESQCPGPNVRIKKLYILE